MGLIDKMKAKRFTRIVTAGERWEVPRGFGARYLASVKDEKRDPRSFVEAASTLLLLVGYDAKPEQIVAWTRRRRVEAVVYSANAHLRASDNPLQAHPRPDWLPEPWQGPLVGQGVFCGPSPTVLT